jgi:Domain of unknown function (DUF4124)
MKCRQWLAQVTAAVAMVIVNLSDLADDLYKTVDAQGHVVYSDRPLSSASQRISVQVSAPNPDEAARLAKEQAMLNADAVQQAQDAQRDAAAQAKKAAQDAAQKRRCESARDRYAVFAAGGRIFKSDEQGNRVYYSDQEIEDQRQAAKAIMDSTCPR